MKKLDAPQFRSIRDKAVRPYVTSTMTVTTPTVESGANYFPIPTITDMLLDWLSRLAGERRSIRVWPTILSSSPSGSSVAVAKSSTASSPTPMTMPDAQTPEQLLEELVRDHLDAVYRVAYSVVRDSALAEDVSQDAILKAWKALPTFRGDSSLRSWVLRITHNTAISTLRKRREELRDPDLLPERETLSTTEHQVVGRLSIDAFEEALNQLDELSRSIVVLREVEGLSYDEISSMLEVPLPTVKTRLLRSRRVLAAALEDWRP